MVSRFFSQRKAVILCIGILCFAAISLVLFLGGSSSASGQSAASARAADPWSPEQTIEPAALAKQVSGAPSQRPKVVCVGFHTLYEGAHVPGADFRGPAINDAGLADLKKWAAPLPRSAELVVYCGCCPLAHCPNVRPAFEALHAMGFTHLKVLLLPHDFAHDWVGLGYPVAKGIGDESVTRVFGGIVEGVGGQPIPPPSATARRIRVSSDVQRTKLVHEVRPKCPTDGPHIQGTVLLRAVIATDGAVEQLQYISGPPLLMRPVMEAVRQWRYRPTLLNGRPVEVETTIPVLCGD